MDTASRPATRSSCAPRPGGISMGKGAGAMIPVVLLLLLLLLAETVDDEIA